ncbi:MAG TPA: TlpA disulfide reductase family protein [Urbifossiella sp.]|nr:TlpA disulfide reductase family protein [Urbifossiella sp.]
MRTTRFTMRVLAALALWAGFGVVAVAQPPTVEKVLEIKPRHPGVAVTTPTPEQAARYRVDPIPNPKTPGANLGFVVRDADGRPVRQLVSYDGKGYNIVAFYLNGQEAYREVYPPSPTEPYQFRWLGPNGGKWGVDRDRDGRIDEWLVISPEEVSQEVLAAVMARDPKRLEALLPTEDDLKGLGLPPAELARIKEKAAGAQKRLAAAAEALKLSPEARWVHLELGVPNTTPQDAFGGKDDMVVHRNGTVLIEDKGKTHFLQTGELIQVGRKWRCVEGPAAGPGAVIADGGPSTPGPVVNDKIRELVVQLDEIDRKEAPNPPAQPALSQYYAKRAGVLEQIVQKLDPADRADWTRLLVDSLAAATEGGTVGSPAHQRFKQWKDQLVGLGPQSPLGAYASFRLLVAENGMALAGAKTGPELQKVQDGWRTGLEAFVKAHPNAEDSGEAVLRLGMANEFLGKDGEPKAKEWYTALTTTYKTHPHAAKAAGAIRRLESEGKALELTGTTLDGQPFSAGSLSGKVVAVYYWASWSSTLADDARKLRDLEKTFAPKGLALVTVCLDDDAKTAAAAVQSAQLPGTHLHAAGGLDRSPLAAGYGIMVVPHIMLAGKDGKVTNRNAQLATLEDELKRLMP